MEPLVWGLYLLAAAAALVVTRYHYRKRETPGRGRMLLAALRWAALALLILLLFDPEVPAPGLAAGDSGTRVLVDASLSMALPDRQGAAASRWDAAVAEAQRLAGTRDVLLFGGAPRGVAADSLAGTRPEAGTTRLLPALKAASESGARRVVVVTDGGIEDGAEVERWLPGLGIDLEVRPIGEAAVTNRAVAEVDAAPWAEAGKPFAVRVGIGSLGASGDSVDVSVRQGDRVLARERVAAPAPGRVAGAALEFTPEAPEGGGLVRYDVVLETADAVPDDDRRSLYVYVDEKPAGVALVSFRPDWEPRFLQPVLEQALGLPVRGFLQVQPGRFVRVGAGVEAGRVATEADVRRAIGQADLLVVHGLNAGAPAWAREAARSARRVLVFPSGSSGDLGLPVVIPTPMPGEWYPNAEVPASPVAALLASIPVAELPPLTDLRPLSLPEGTWAPLEASLARRGAGSPVAVAAERDGRRAVIATADGYWRWAFRGGEARQAYRRLWSALGGWLLQEEGTVAAGAIRPVARTVPRDEPLRWIASGMNADSVAVRVTAGDGTVAMDTVVALARGDTAVTPPLPPGHYRFEARAFADGNQTAAAEGPVTVESYSPEFIRASASIAELDGAASPPDRPRPLPREPLHTTPWPYLLLVMLVSTEWVLRRRWGLR